MVRPLRRILATTCAIFSGLLIRLQGVPNSFLHLMDAGICHRTSAWTTHSW